MGMNVGYFHGHDSDKETESTMKRMRSGDTGPNGTPSGVLQKGPPQQATGVDQGNTPNSSPSDTNSGANYGQKLVTGYPEVPAVMPLAGIPAREPEPGGASELQKGNENYGFTTRRSGGSA